MHVLRIAIALLAHLVLLKAEDTGYELLVQSAPEAWERNCTTVDAESIGQLNGVFMQPSVGIFELGGTSFTAALDGFGKMHRFEFDVESSQVCVAAKIIPTGFYNQSIEAGTIALGILFEETTPPRSCPNPMCNLMGANDNVFVNTIEIDGHFFVLTDTPQWVEMDADSMGIVDVWAWNESDSVVQNFHMGMLGSAHPLVRPGKTGDDARVVGIQSDMPMGFGHTQLDVWAVDPSNPHRRELLNRVNMDELLDDAWMPYLHSFGLTEDLAVLPLMPVNVDMTQVMKGQPLKTAFSDVPSMPNGTSMFVVAPLDGSDTTTYTVPEFFFIHTVNTFVDEKSGEIVIDLSTAKSNPLVGSGVDIDAIRNKTQRDEVDHMVVKRFRLDPSDGSSTVETISDPAMSTDFIKPNPRVNGLEYCYYWADVWDYVEGIWGSMAVVKQDLCSGDVEQGRMFWHRAGWFPSEPTMVPSDTEGAEEDEGDVLFTALEGATGITYLVVVDAMTMESKLEMPLDGHIPFTTHGQFYSW